MAFTIDIRDECLPAITRLKEALSPAKLNPAIGAAETLLFQNHFAELPANKMGFPTTGFWKGAARGTNYGLLADGIAINVSQQGVRQRLEGGEIQPTGGKKYLTIPARAEAYGKRAGEFNNLRLAFHRVGGHVEAFALVEAAATQIKVGKAGKTGARKITPGVTTGGGVYFWLVKSVDQKPDPSVIPSEAQIIEVATKTATGVADRAQKRGGTS